MDIIPWDTHRAEKWWNLGVIFLVQKHVHEILMTIMPIYWLWYRQKKNILFAHGFNWDAKKIQQDTHGTLLEFTGNIPDRQTWITLFWTVQDGCSRRKAPLQANIRRCDRPARSSRDKKICFGVPLRADRGVVNVRTCGALLHDPRTYRIKCIQMLSKWVSSWFILNVSL